jgi:hypothetical protein
VRKYIAKRGHRRPEDRLRAAVIASGIVTPLSAREFYSTYIVVIELTNSWVWLAHSDWVSRLLLRPRKARLIDSAGGIGPPIVMLILSAAALMFILTPLNT